MNYELCIIYKPDMTEEARLEHFNRVKEVITDGGEIKEIDEWGNRKLAYEINHIRDGYYIFVTFTANSEIIAELNRRLNIADDVIRHMIVREDD